MLLSVLQLSLGICNVWPKRMNLKAFISLYILMLLATMPVTLLSCIPYGLFGIPMTICIYGLATCRDGAAQNVCMGMIGFILTIMVDNLLTNFLHLLIPLSFMERQYASFNVNLIYTLLFYLMTLFFGRLLKKLLLSGKSVLRFPQTWYLIDAGLLLLITIYLFDNLIPGQNGSVGKMIYNNVLHISGYLLVMLFLFLVMRCFYLEKMQTEAKQKAIRDLQDYTYNLEAMYNGLRSFKHDYINILLSMSGYIKKGDMDELRQFFETKIFPTKNLIDQGDYKINQLGNIDVLEIKSLLCAKIIYAHESGIDVTIDIPDRVESFPMDTVDLARILGIFSDNAIEAAALAQQPQIGLNIIQHKAWQAIVQTIQNTVLIEEPDMRLVLDTGDPYVLLEKIKGSQSTGIYFLDIDLGSNINGMKLAQQIRLLDPSGFIIFITAHSELSYMTFQYRVEAMDFVLKNPAEMDVKIRECLLNAIERYTLQTNRTHRVYTIETGGRKISIDYDDILFFETSGNAHKVILHGKDRQIEFPGAIKELTKTLDGDFVRCHRSFLINKKNIKEADTKNRMIYFTNGETCLISTRMMKGL